MHICLSIIWLQGYMQTPLFVRDCRCEARKVNKRHYFHFKALLYGSVSSSIWHHQNITTPLDAYGKVETLDSGLIFIRIYQIQCYCTADHSSINGVTLENMDSLWIIPKFWWRSALQPDTVYHPPVVVIFALSSHIDAEPININGDVASHETN